MGVLLLKLVIFSLFVSTLNAKILNIDIIENGNKISKTLYQAKNLNHGLSNDFKFLIADLDESGNPIFHNWTPTEEHFRKAEENIYVNHEEKAAIRLGRNGEMKGIYKNFAIKSKGHGKEFHIEQPNLRNDYWKMNDTLTFNPKPTTRSISGDKVETTVELVLIADKEFCDVFGQNYQKILEYFIVLMWDINMRYKTLPRTKISWQLNGVVAISNPGAQPFIEESRASDGRVEHGRTLVNFGKWMDKNRQSLPPFDLASVVTNAKQEWGGGLAWMNAPCRIYGSSVWNDNGDFGVINVMAHELGHNLGGPHDDDTNYPGGCSVGSTYIMGGSSNDHRYYFSSCSDRTIGDFVRSDEASCLQTLSSRSPITSPDFDSTAAPSSVDQCRRKHLEDPNAWVTNENCKSTTCNWRSNGATSGGWSYSEFPPLDNTPCEGNRRCFRGKCRQKGHIIMNVGSGSDLCLEAPDNWAKMEPVRMSYCPQGVSPLRRFVLKDGTLGSFIETPYISNENGRTESLDKCLFTGNKEGDAIWTDTCSSVHDSTDNPWHGWTWVDLGNSQFLLKHKLTGRCAKVNSRSNGAYISTFAACDSGNADYKWVKYLGN